MSDFERIVGFADPYGTRARVLYFGPEDGDDEGCIQVAVEVGQCSGVGHPTAEAARQMAAALLDAADRMDSAQSEAA